MAHYEINWRDGGTCKAASLAEAAREAVENGGPNGEFAAIYYVTESFEGLANQIYAELGLSEED